MALTADLRSLSCLLGFFAREVMRVFILLKSSRKCYCSLKFIEVWICMCDHLSHKKIKVINFCWYIQDLISSACSWFTSFLWMNFSELLLCSSLCQFNLTGQVWGEGKCQERIQQTSVGWRKGWGDASNSAWAVQHLCTPGSESRGIWRTVPVPG